MQHLQRVNRHVVGRSEYTIRPIVGLEESSLPPAFGGLEGVSLENLEAQVLQEGLGFGLHKNRKQGVHMGGK
jgi:hypothetical protein